MAANLLVTYDPSHSGKAMQEVKLLLKELDEEADFEDSDTDGVFLLNVKDPKNAVKRLSRLCDENPENFRYTHRWIPIEKWISSGLDEMQSAMSEMDEKIDDDERWKLDLTKRHYDEHSTPELIKKLTENINKQHVDLKNPEKIVKVEILGSKAGVALLEKDELLEVDKHKK